MRAMGSFAGWKFDECNRVYRQSGVPVAVCWKLYLSFFVLTDVAFDTLRDE
jgi:hypothetical protein